MSLVGADEPMGVSAADVQALRSQLRWLAAAVMWDRGKPAAQAVDSLVPQIQEQIAEVVKGAFKQSVEQRTAEHLGDMLAPQTDVPVSHAMEETIEAVKHVPQECVPHHTVQQLVDVPDPQFQGETGEMTQLIVETIIDIPVPQIRAPRAEVVKASPRRVQPRTGDNAADVLVPQIGQEIGEVILPIPRTVARPYLEYVDASRLDVA